MDDIARLQDENNALLRDMEFLRKELDSAQLTIKSLHMKLIDYYMGRAISGILANSGGPSDEAVARRARRIAEQCMRFRTGESL